LAFSCFVVRPFNKRKLRVRDVEVEVHFEDIHLRLIARAMVKAGLAGNTTQDIAQAGNSREDMFLLLAHADVVLADISLHNANVFYELGARHALHSPMSDAARRIQTERVDLGGAVSWSLRRELGRQLPGSDEARWTLAGDGPGGTQHMVQMAHAAGAEARHLDTVKLFHAALLQRLGGLNPEGLRASAGATVRPGACAAPALGQGQTLQPARVVARTTQRCRQVHPEHFLSNALESFVDKPVSTREYGTRSGSVWALIGKNQDRLRLRGQLLASALSKSSARVDGACFAGPDHPIPTDRS